MEEEKLSFIIDTTESISVEAFSKSLVAFNDEFKRLNSNSKELRINKIKEGSFIVDFVVGTIVTTLPFLSNANTIIEFLEHLKNVKDYILGNKEANYITDKSIENTANIIQPLVNCGSNCTININYGEQKVNFTQSECDTISEKTPTLIKNIIGKQEESESSHFRKKVLFYWYQTCFDKNKVNKGNKGIIDNIVPETPIAVIFEDDNSIAKKEMTTSIDNIDWQRRGYIVDVEVLKAGDRIVKYKIVNNYPGESVPDLFD
jgi:hypothetical protein